MAAKRILIVEDERVVAEQLRQSLNASGYDVVGIASSGEEAIRDGQRTRPDLVVMDIVLAGKLDGITAAEQLQFHGIPVVYLTAHSDRHLLDRAEHTEPLGYIIKPAKSGELAAVIRLALFKRDQEQSRDRAGQEHAAFSREAEAQFRLMVAGVTDVAIFTLDTAGNVNSWNLGAERINGYSRERILGRPHAVLFPVEDRQANVPQTELDLAALHGSADNTRWLVRENGERYWAEGVLTAIRDTAGVLTGFTKITRDATVQKQTRDALQKTQEQLRIALHAARMGTWSWNIRNNTDYLDDSLRALFGLRPDQEVRTIEDFYALVHPEDRAAVIASFDRTRLEGVHLDTEFRVKQPGGDDRWFMDQGEVFTDEHGKPERMSGACVDITERKQAEIALRKSEERFRLFVNNVRDYALFQTDEDGCITAWNSGAERMLGYTAAEILGRPSAVLFLPEDVASRQPERELLEAATVGRAEDERWHVRKDGGRFWCRGVTTAMKDGAGQLRGFAKVMRDETERRQSNERLTTSLLEKEALLKEIHHRVKNNLQVITSLLTLQSNTVEDEKTREMFEEAVNRVRTIGDIHELLYRSPDLAYIDFKLYLQRLAQNLLSFYGVHPDQVRVVVSAEDTKLELLAAIPCGLIVNELLTNSLKHGFPQGRSGQVRVSLDCKDGDCMLEVSDDGVGLPVGFAVEETTSLGLKLVSVLAQQLQGTVQFINSDGANVVISFPYPRTTVQ